MKAIITSLLIFGTGAAAYGQGALTIHVANSNTKYAVSNNGTFFHNPLPGATGGYFVPKDSMVSAIYAMSIMAAGTDGNGNIKGAAAQYMNSDFSPGPYVPDQANYTTQSYLDKYGNSIWDVTKAEIDDHIAHWMDAGYVVPGWISTWPGNGNTGNGESALLAPFHDMDGDNIYEPESGDYPLIRGDKAVYTIINDGKGVHQSGMDPAKLEIHMLFYQYDVPSDQALSNTVFFQTTVFNRGSLSLFDFHIGHLLDFDLGNPFDDYIGSEPDRHLAYVYNGDPNDEDFSGNPGFGAMAPAAGILNLDGTLSSNIQIPNLTTLSVSSEYNNVLSGLLPNGAPLLDGNNQPTTFVYNDITPGNWNELSLSNTLGDRRSIIGHHAETLSPGKVLCYNHAAIFARTYDANLTASVDSLFQVADHIQDFYDNQDFYCETQFMGLDEDTKLAVSIYPNPARDFLRVDGLTSGIYRIVNPEGKELLTGNLENPVIPVDSLKNGFYILEITSGGKYDRKSFIKD